jgi:hypothetical protein
MELGDLTCRARVIDLVVGRIYTKIVKMGGIVGE